LTKDLLTEFTGRVRCFVGVPKGTPHLLDLLFVAHRVL